MTSSEPLLGGGLLFCDARFHDLNGVPVGERRRYEHRSDGRLVGVLDGVAADDVFVSGHSAPFGGPDLVEATPVDDVLGLVTGALAAFRADGIREVRIRARPPVYSAAEPLLEYALLHLGFTVAHCDLNQHVDLTGVDGAPGVLSLFKDRRRRYVRAALGRAHELSVVEGGEDLTTLHRIIADNRVAHGRPPGLPREYLERMKQAFPERVRLLLLREAGTPVAAAVVYRVLTDVDQVVHWADAGDADRNGRPTPMGLLAYLVLAESLRTGARLVDLGPSSEKDGTPNLGLVNFKRSVGALPGTRKVFVAGLD
ncbi:GNAT family N-acetyltransferase [Blastococcus sp. CT_GayMR16]|uniref:GNAT family N-acetyltransferase n=1 Tax=Blastococcus sp. CT_GayMR16 TaxID=2559607 RepID=UPI001073D44F|nr:GNAT family N-acetyltransferase [Blastococcus sp. CT_GayMR16]TFV83297.1 GNAT family N-acetyltransferase [Blastococcus sp. CT_GayMR16]